MKALGIAAAIAIALAPLPAVAATTPGVAHAAPCAGAGSNPTFCDECLFWVAEYHLRSSRSCYEEGPPPRPAQPPSSAVPVQIPPAPPVPVVPQPPPPRMTQVVPAPPSPVHGPKINPLPPGASRSAPLVTPPKRLDAPTQAVEAAKAAPATRVSPGMDKMLQVVDFNHQVQTVVDAHNGNVDVIKADNQSMPRPRLWDYVDYDAYHRPMLYNPLNEAMTFRYFYNGAYREAYVPAGGRIVLDAAAAGLYPFTAVGDSHVAAGSFRGGAWIPPEGWDGPPPPDYALPPAPEVYRDVVAEIPADDKAVSVGQVQLVGHDDSQPAGSRDTFLLDDSTLAWGQINDPGGSSQIKVTKTQSLPGVGPTDNGSYLVALAALEEPNHSSGPWWPSALGYGTLALAVVLVAWGLSRGNREET
ncbi:hypothetical protein [Mycobacterium celatum]|uniref:Uncharacterized protein n=1 Tax=Mycobacterium celatum TaxID=28045 RepID=A0A1X1RUF2_MYCCE|nr:hypothetical protein [Mycobacterium celatum]ORV17930.1 hypothetical protein AWB95_05925 [Mycobacterium celatum]PIB74728.1 hypothetical protein CQY23_21230 [Mycobacterium celatum]